MDFSKFENSVQNYTGTVRDKFLVINGNTVSVKNKTDENAENITGLISEIAQLRQYVDEADNSIHGDIYSVNENITKLKADTSVLRNDLDTLHASCNFTFNGIIADVSTLKDWKSSHTTDYNTLVTADANINSSISSIKTDVTNINSSISEIKSDVSALQSWKDTIDNGCLVDVDSLKSDVSALNIWKDNHVAEYNALVTKDAQIDSSINRIREMFSYHVDQYEDLYSIVEGHTNELRDMRNKIGNEYDSSTANTLFGMLKALKEQVDDNELVVAQALVDLNNRIGN